MYFYKDSYLYPLVHLNGLANKGKMAKAKAILNPASTTSKQPQYEQRVKALRRKIIEVNEKLNRVYVSSSEATENYVNNL